MHVPFLPFHPLHCVLLLSGLRVGLLKVNPRTRTTVEDHPSPADVVSMTFAQPPRCSHIHLEIWFDPICQRRDATVSQSIILIGTSGTKTTSAYRGNFKHACTKQIYSAKRSAYWATCHSSLSAHSFFLSVNKTSATSLAPLPLRQLVCQLCFMISRDPTYMTIS